MPSQIWICSRNIGGDKRCDYINPVTEIICRKYGVIGKLEFLSILDTFLSREITSDVSGDQNSKDSTSKKS